MNQEWMNERSQYIMLIVFFCWLSHDGLPLQDYTLEVWHVMMCSTMYLGKSRMRLFRIKKEKNFNISLDFWNLFAGGMWPAGRGLRITGLYGLTNDLKITIYNIKSIIILQHNRINYRSWNRYSLIFVIYSYKIRSEKFSLSGYLSPKLWLTIFYFFLGISKVIHYYAPSLYRYLNSRVVMFHEKSLCWRVTCCRVFKISLYVGEH